MKINALKCFFATLIAGLLGSAVQAQYSTAVAQDSLSSQTKVAQSTTSEMINGDRPSFRTWSIGVNAGALSPISPFGGKNDFSNWKVDIGYGFYIKKQLTPYFSLRLDGVGGKLKGDNSEPYESDVQNKNSVKAFETNLTYSASLSAVINMFNISMFRKDDVVQLYALAGAGLSGYKVKTMNNNSNTLNKFGKKNGMISELVIPVGLGAKYKVSELINIDLGWTVNFVDGDNLDGTYFGNNNDKFNYAYAGLEFALGKGKQLAFHNPVALTYDEALAAKRATEAMKADLDAQKEENNKLRTEMADILKDSDEDGVADKLDKCPGTPKGTVVDGSGCPMKAPVQVEKVIITDEDRKIVKDAIKNLEFDFGKASIRAKSNSSLIKVANLLTQKNFSLKLAGHTDSKGSDATNLKLSKARAESVKSFLVAQGANASRIEATGYGESQPIASNKTESGRQKNRRVEFTLY